MMRNFILNKSQKGLLCLQLGSEQVGDIATKWSEIIITLTRSLSKNIHTKPKKVISKVKVRQCIFSHPMRTV